jgi:hypothetical protein
MLEISYQSPFSCDEDSLPGKNFHKEYGRNARNRRERDKIEGRNRQPIGEE